jgi:hypothetical protein
VASKTALATTAPVVTIGGSRNPILSPKHRNPNSSHVSYFAQTRKTTPVILNMVECVERATTANFAAAFIV